MTTLQRIEQSHFTPEQLFELVADVEKYPEFIPWCSAARITERLDENSFLAELVINFKALREKYTSKVTLTRPETKDGTYYINAEMVEGPFHHLRNDWQLTPTEDGGTEISLKLDFRFKSRMLEKLIGGLFGKASEKMVGAFRQRARDLYDN